MENTGDIIKREIERDKITNEKFISYLKIKANYCTIKQDALELFFIWIIEKGVMRSISAEEYPDLDIFIEENVDSFYDFFISNNKLGEGILLSKEALKYSFVVMSNNKNKIYDLLQNKGYISAKDNIGNRFTPNKAKWFNDLPTEEQLEIEGIEQNRRDKLFQKFKGQ